jgi:hypothetical protein
MKNSLKLMVTTFALIFVTQLANAQTQKTTNQEETPVTTEAPETNVEITEPKDSSITEGTPSTTSANEKPGIRYKLYSGKQRGNNVVYDPKK